MDEDSKSKLKDILSTIDPVEYKWDNTAQPGVIAQEISSIDGLDTITLTGSQDYNINMTGPITIDTGAINWGSSAYTISSVGANGSTEYGSNQIKLGNGKNIDLDELYDVVETMKKRLLILAPNFEMHEKYPMLKELYNEYKAMEKLLGGPDAEPEDM